ncbi:8481_t:CDS:1, partial [Acaulospora morrowiae]
GCHKYTFSTTGCCPDYSSRFHSLNYRMRQKYGAEALQPKIPEAPISKSDDSSASIHEHLFPTSSQLFADSLRRDLMDSIQVEILGDRVVINGSATKSLRIYEDPVSESDNEYMGLGFFGD